MIYIDSSVKNLIKNIQIELSKNNQNIEIDLSLNIIYIFSSVESIELINNEN